MIKRYISLFMAVVITLSPALSYAGWVDDWIQQKTETNAGYFEGQKRGYFTAGSFSARWKQNNDYFFTVMPPKVKIGCGGIDAFMGGFAFMRDAEYLKQKFEMILTAQTAAAAFDLALNVLCEPCSKIMKSLEAISSSLNNIQLDECKASRALVATVVKGAGFAGRHDQQLADIQGDFMQSTGISDLWTTISRDTRANSDNPQTDLSQSVQDCSNDVKEIFTFVDLNNNKGAILGNLAAKFGIHPDHVNLIRGYIGDIIITKSNNGLVFSFDPPCEENKSMNSDNFLDGEVFAKTAEGACYQITDSNKDLTRYVQDRISGVAEKIKNRQVLAPEDEAFINSNPLPITLILKYAVGTDQEAAIITNLSDITAKAYSLAILSDLYYRALNMMHKARSLMSAQKTAGTNSPQHRCRVELLEDTDRMISDMQERVYILVKGVNDAYRASTSEVNALLNLVERLNSFYETSYRHMVSKFGKAVTERALSE